MVSTPHSIPPAAAPGEDDLDILKEVFNLGVGAATSAFHEWVGRPVEITVPTFQLLERAQVEGLLGARPPICVLAQPLERVLGGGHALLGFHCEVPDALLRARRPQAPPAGDALAAVGSLVLQACLEGIGEATGTALDLGAPIVVGWDGRLEPVFASPAHSLGMVDIGFGVEGTDVRGKLTLLVDAEGMQRLIRQAEAVILG